MLIALTRAVSPTLTRCELTHLPREPIDLSLAVRQHQRYERALEELGCQVRRLSPEPDLPDAVFVEDTAIVLDECAVMARPGAASRRPETTSVVAGLCQYRSLHPIEPPGTLDGGDVLRASRHIYVGLSSRTNEDGARQLDDLLAPMGYTVERVAVRGCLHLKSAVTTLSDDELLLNPILVDATLFGELKWTAVHPAEPFAANVLSVGGRVLCQASAPRTRERMEARGYEVIAVDVSEFAKAEGGLTCCSLVFSA